jgi:hypothetical protein
MEITFNNWNFKNKSFCYFILRYFKSEKVLQVNNTSTDNNDAAIVQCEYTFIVADHFKSTAIDPETVNGIDLFKI